MLASHHLLDQERRWSGRGRDKLYTKHRMIRLTKKINFQEIVVFIYTFNIQMIQKKNTHVLI